MRLHTRRPHAFTLVELLVVIGIIALLIGILLPTLSKARESAKTVKCASNLRVVGQGVAAYVVNFRGTLPNSYVYEGMSIASGTQLPTVATKGYLHWSGQLLGRTGQVASPMVFTCPTIDNGGLPPTNPPDGGTDSGQKPETPGVTDMQAPRMAYSLNEALCGRNKFVVGFQSAVSTFRFVRAASVRNSQGTILATEFINNWGVVSDAPRTSSGPAVCKSHRPLHGFNNTTGTAGAGGLNMELTPNYAVPQRVTYDMLCRNTPVEYDSGTTRSRLDWVGRNHGTGTYDKKLTNFLYLDGHVETKHVRDTFTPWQWGERFYSLDTTGAGL